MRLQYQWRQKEWQEVVRLASRRHGSAPSLPGMTLAMIVLPVIGGASELIAAPAMRQHMQVGGSILPVLLAIGLAVVALRLMRTRDAGKYFRPIPEAECFAVLSETGWRIGSEPPAELWPWSELTGMRQGEEVLVLLREEGFEALPLRVLTLDQGGRLHRLLARKLRQRLLS